MKKVIIAFGVASLLLSSCGTYSASGAVVGAQFGTILGSAVGGLAGGWRGSHIGTIAGMAGGAAVGAAIGSAADQAQAKRYEEHRAARAERQREYAARSSQQTTQQSDVPADDRIDLGIPGPQGQTSQAPQTIQGQQSLPEYRVPSQPQTAKKKAFDLQSQVELRNLQVIEGMEDGILRGGESCKIIFEIMNRTPQTIYNVAPTVTDLSQSKHVYISPDLNIESIAPGTGIRYTATITTGKKLKDGQVVIHVGVSVNNQEIASQSKEITLPTARK